MSKVVHSKKVQRKAAIASLIGASIEYYDYLLYGTVATLVFNKVFFTNFDPTMGLLIALASFGIPYFFRPLGGIIFSHIGDRVGRKTTLILTLGIMGVSTALIGVLPTYNSIGIWAPIFLVSLRLIQGIAVGGEWGGAVLLSVEYADENKRGFAGSIPMMGAAIGMVLATATMAIATLLPDTSFLSWGWRVPFVASLVLVVVGLWIRSGLAETPDFEKTKAEGNVSKLPISDVLKHHWKDVLLTAGVKGIETAPFYLFATFGISYATNTLDMPENPVLMAVTIGTLVSILIIPIAGRLADRVGTRKVFTFGTWAVMIFIIPFFMLLSLKSIFVLTVAVMVGFAIWSIITAVLGTMFVEVYKPEIRYTGISLGYQLGAAIFGGTVPLLSTYLINRFNSWLPVAIYLILLGVIALISNSLIRRRMNEYKKQKRVYLESSEIYS
ncbi:metabolite-proton symporter [Virgibacillus halotolerans]|uniref:MFS transporter n=1 Tax=Virgibacillus halotolerans TaxID=1071053 RepID=UPI001960A8A3|nr:MFS transporter [Virgibacillus halotolerans]MBM7599677.1 metabolite-proton symporter [Virgibacillus halotolerans]